MSTFYFSIKPGDRVMPNVSQQRFMEVTPLIEAIWAEDDSLIRSLGTDAKAINALDSDGRTALTEVINDRLIEYFDLFVEHGADIHTADNGGWTPLHFATQALDPHIVQQLLSRGADPNATNQHGNTPIGAAIMRSRHNRDNALEICKLLIHAGADPDIKNNYGVSPLSLVCDSLKDKEFAAILNSA